MQAHPPTSRIPYIFVDRAILGHAVAIKSIGIALFVALAAYLPDIRPSEEHLATQHLGITARTVRNHLPGLTERGLVTVHRDQVQREKTRNRSLIATGAAPIILPRRLLTVGLDVTAIAVYTVMAGRGDAEPAATIQWIAKHLSVRRQRIGPVLDALIDHRFVVPGKRLPSSSQPFHLVERPPVNVRFLPPNIHEERGGPAPMQRDFAPRPPSRHVAIRQREEFDAVMTEVTGGNWSRKRRGRQRRTASMLSRRQG
jgi:hypothetical protein